MKPATRQSSLVLCPLHGTAPASAKPAAPCVLVNGEPLSILADVTGCGGVVSQGASTVLAGQLPAAHLEHTTLHGGVIMTGSTDVLIGGPTFALPSNIVIAGGPAFQNKVLRDLFFLSQTEQGRKVLDRLAASGKTVTIRDRQDRPFWWKDDNFTVPADADAPGPAVDVVIYYDTDPARRVVYSEAGENQSTTTTSPQVNLFHEMVHGMHMAEGTALAPDDYLPQPPGAASAGEPYKREEARTIGDTAEGYGNESPSENALRDELGMPRRKQIGLPGPKRTADFPGATDHRPGSDP